MLPWMPPTGNPVQGDPAGGYPDPMCGRFALHATGQELAQGLRCPRLAGLRIEARYNVAPGQWILVVRPERDGLGPGLAQWGLIPSWAKEPREGPRPINARAEGLEAKPTFRGAFRHGRCVVPASGFYEWKTEAGRKRPFYIRPRDGGLFLFAGLCSTWAGPEGEIDTCALVTTTPNAVMAPIHARMPVILPLDHLEAWLDPGNQKAAALLRPCDEAVMEAFPVSTAVGNSGNEGPSLIIQEAD